MSSPKVSIIMAVFNRANTLPRAIDSVLSSVMLDWELIIVDDGSTDNSRMVIERYLAMDSRIRAAYHESNMHVHAAKNTGLDLMQGEWFTILGSPHNLVGCSETIILHNTVGRLRLLRYNNAFVR